MELPKVSLALSGGAIKGANQAGGLLCLEEARVGVEVVTGTSVGALNGALFCQNETKTLANIWLNEIKKRQDIIKHWLVPYLPFLWKGALYNSKPLRNLINKYVNEDKLIKSERRFISCSVNHNTKQKVYVASTKKNRAKIKDFVYASAAFPVFMEPLKHNGDLFEDGGSQEPIPVREAHEKSKKAEKIIIMLASRDVTKRRDVSKRYGRLLLSTIDNLFEEVYQNDIHRGLLLHWGSNRFETFKTKNLFSDSFDVNESKIKKSFEDGYNEMRKIITKLKSG